MSLADRLNEDDGSFAAAWRPEPGEMLVGKIVGFSQRVGGYSDDPYLILTIRQENGEKLAVHAFHYVLAEELRKYKLREGTEIGIKYFGKPEGKNYAHYRVVAEADINMPGEADPAYKPEPVSDVPATAAGFTPAAPAPDDDIPFLWDGPQTFEGVKLHAERPF